MNEELHYPQPSGGSRRGVWNGRRIRALREYLKLTQRQMAEELQVRQQTISEWETGLRMPHRSTQKMLSLVAERAGFAYEVTPSGESPPGNQEPPPEPPASS